MSVSNVWTAATWQFRLDLLRSYSSRFNEQKKTNKKQKQKQKQKNQTNKQKKKQNKKKHTNTDKNQELKNLKKWENA